MKDQDFEIFLTTAPGLEPVLCAEVRGKGFKQPKPVPGGVIVKGGWPEVWRANLWIRGAGRVLARIDSFYVVHLAQLADRARRVPWGRVLRPDVPFRIEASCTGSRIYHTGAAAERIEIAIRETLGAPYSPDADVAVKARIEHDLCTISVDTSGDPLHKRGYKSVYIPRPMVCGLSPETFDDFILQKSRWAQGMAQIFVLSNPLFEKGLSFYQKICYFNSSFILCAFFNAAPA